MKCLWLVFLLSCLFGCQATTLEGVSQETSHNHRCGHETLQRIQPAALLAALDHFGNPWHPETEKALLLTIGPNVCSQCLYESLSHLLNSPLQMDKVALVPPGSLEGFLKGFVRLKLLPETCLIQAHPDANKESFAISVIDWPAHKVIKTYRPELSHNIPECLKDVIGEL